MSRQTDPYYPVFLNIAGRKCVVVGGGQVALRKVSTLLEHGAKVDVISPDLCPEMDGLARSGRIEVVRRGYKTGDLSGALVAIAAIGIGNIFGNQLRNQFSTIITAMSGSSKSKV